MFTNTQKTKSITQDTQNSLPIIRIEDEADNVKTFYFNYPLDSKPGQFVLMWIPYLNQKPFSISYDNGVEFGLTIFKLGDFTEKLFSMQVGELVGITGPYGSTFSVKPDVHYITVAGGYGAGPLGSLAEQVLDMGSTVDFCVGARNESLLLFEKRVSGLNNLRLHVSTDDGSKGHKGYVTEILEALLRHYKNNNIGKKIIVATCGPELMEKRVLELANKYEVDCEISVERYMKCGYSVCGQCCVDPLGIPLCSIGPVLNKSVVNQLSEFGKYHRDKTGTKHFY